MQKFLEHVIHSCSTVKKNNNIQHYRNLNKCRRTPNSICCTNLACSTDCLCISEQEKIISRSLLKVYRRETIRWKKWLIKGCIENLKEWLFDNSSCWTKQNYSHRLKQKQQDIKINSEKWCNIKMIAIFKMCFVNLKRLSKNIGMFVNSSCSNAVAKICLQCVPGGTQ